ncbi:MAG: DUF4149 domain-containing protein [Terriglobales bacterium]
MSLLRFLMSLSLSVWVGGLIFFAFVVAPAAFSVLPTHHYAGEVVSRTLGRLHWIGIASGLVYLGTSMAYAYAKTGGMQPLAARHVLIVLMIALTLTSQLAISGKMLALRQDMKVIDNVPQDDPRRVEFNRLHHWSTRLEGAVLLMGLAAIYLTARKL